MKHLYYKLFINPKTSKHSLKISTLYQICFIYFWWNTPLVLLNLSHYIYICHISHQTEIIYTAPWRLWYRYLQWLHFLEDGQEETKYPSSTKTSLLSCEKWSPKALLWNLGRKLFPWLTMYRVAMIPCGFHESDKLRELDLFSVSDTVALTLVWKLMETSAWRKLQAYSERKF